MLLACCRLAYYTQLELHTTPLMTMLKNYFTWKSLLITLVTIFAIAVTGLWIAQSMNGYDGLGFIVLTWLSLIGSAAIVLIVSGFRIGYLFWQARADGETLIHYWRSWFLRGIWLLLVSFASLGMLVALPNF